MIKTNELPEYFGDPGPSVGIVLGSGLGNLLDSVTVLKKLPYADIEGFPRSTVPGHAGEFVLADIGGVRLLAAKGRFHYYEGYDLDAVLSIVKTFHALGIKKVIITNAAGLIDPAYAPGDILLIRDCVDMTTLASGMKAESARIRPAEAAAANEASRLSGIAIGEGVYVWTTGPSYETPAEIKYFASLGGDLVGMSTMPEIMWAREHGMDVYPFSCATNWAAGIATKPL
ncbi:MAG: purine-nucleoside phosphorylase, partial [Candidatus Marinimicrobia bacterium]|nr:purine-nucleoside phosphorylase [Candidatus Neomarinimicrobiota bacterium]